MNLVVSLVGIRDAEGLFNDQASGLAEVLTAPHTLCPTSLPPQIGTLGDAQRALGMH